MSDPRYVPRDFLVYPGEFGRLPSLQWRRVEEDWSLERRAQREASITQHQISYGVRALYMQKPRSTKLTDLATELQVEYHRLQKMLRGVVVMQMVDVARLRLLVGVDQGCWSERGGFTHFSWGDCGCHGRCTSPNTPEE
ncbi:hypothetical protein J7E45_11345 [Microbacterium sp. ISL-59]|uniref:hypothetical protein n=1 Tax=Microbacterium sp. ISL-59 TaxID=2819159 RepID=UPI001BEB0DB4|nr:hypothetical protein [Microbacterium sp. ISL-59]MBT2496204.1 hypothetical protein [Microbacterium sp. ISL-59]